jgi:hypothetical protein
LLHEFKNESGKTAASENQKRNLTVVEYLFEQITIRRRSTAPLLISLSLQCGFTALHPWIHDFERQHLRLACRC